MTMTMTATSLMTMAMLVPGHDELHTCRAAPAGQSSKLCTMLLGVVRISIKQIRQTQHCCLLAGQIPDALQVAGLQHEVTTLRNSLQAKDAELANAAAVGDGKVQELEAARQELSLKLESAQQQMQVSRLFLLRFLVPFVCL